LRSHSRSFGCPPATSGRTIRRERGNIRPRCLSPTRRCD
jgi:hypothetical protein